MAVTSAQVRMARAALNWTVRDLADSRPSFIAIRSQISKLGGTLATRRRIDAIEGAVKASRRRVHRRERRWPRGPVAKAATEKELTACSCRMGAVSVFSWTAPSRRLAKPVCLGNSEALARPTDIQRVRDLRSGSAGVLHPKAKSSRRDKRPPNRHLPRRARAGRSFLVGNLVGYRK